VIQRNVAGLSINIDIEINIIDKFKVLHFEVPK
jgi:hypothetical protein